MKDLSKITLYLFFGAIGLLIAAILFQSSYVRKLYDFPEISEDDNSVPEHKKAGRPKKIVVPEADQEPEIVSEPKTDPLTVNPVFDGNE